MDRYENLKWEVLDQKSILKTPVYEIISMKERAATGIEGDYVAIKAPEWVVVIPVHGENFVPVKQYRHGEGRITMEFPGGVVDGDEDPKATAIRELEEETGYRAGKITCLGKVSPNPALFQNHFSVFLAEELVQTGSRNLDEDEVLNFEEMPAEEVIRRFGDEEFTHAFMGTALAFYFRHKTNQKDKI